MNVKKKYFKFSLKLKVTVILLKVTHQYDANKNSLKLSESGKKTEKYADLEKQQKNGITSKKGLLKQTI